MSKEGFIQTLGERGQGALYEAAANYINPDLEAMQTLYDLVLDALSRFEVPEFTDEETTAYTFQALFEARLMKEWLIWLDSQLKTKTNGNIFLSEICPEEVRRLTGAYIKGQHEARLISSKESGINKLVIFGPYKDPVEIVG